MKEKLFKFLFPKFYKKYEERGNRVDVLHELVKSRTRHNDELMDKLEHYVLENNRFKSEVGFDDMLVELGLPIGIDFSNVDDEGKPPHYLAKLSPEARKHYIGCLEAIYSDPKFKQVCDYVINVVGNHSIQKAADDKMRNGKIAIIGIRTLLTEFSNAHAEFLASTTHEEGFDPLETMPG